MIESFWEDIPAAKLHKAAFMMAKKVGKKLQESGEMSLPQFMLLGAIEHRDESNQAELAHMRDLTEAAISRLVEGLQKKGLVSREENKDNRREHLLKLTEKGKQDLAKMTEVAREVMGEMWNKMEKADRVKLDQLLDKLLVCVNS